jgi:folylpolyglutamate synthase/dihydropteroate synthase
LPLADEITMTRADHPKAADPFWLQETALGMGRSVATAKTPLEALASALDQAASGDLIVATGSLFLVADVREAWFQIRGLPMPPRDPEGSY